MKANEEGFNGVIHVTTDAIFAGGFAAISAIVLKVQGIEIVITPAVSNCVKKKKH